jgi:tetratricopeptide (TPR) repeat protein
MALTGFDCASTEMTTAKVAIKSRDFAKAEESLKKEVAARPQNSEAWFILGDLYNQQERYTEMVNAYAKARAGQPPLSADNLTKIAIDDYNAWLSKYNEAQKNYSSKAYDMALRNIDTAIMLRPDYADNVLLRGLVYREQQNTAEENRAYARYIELVTPDVEAGMQAGLALGMTRAQVEAKLGKPTREKISDSTGGYAYYEPKNLSVYYVAAKTGEAPTVNGWRFFKGATTDLQKQIEWSIRSAPYYTLGVDAYREGENNKARFDDALKYLQVVERLDPQQEGVGPVIADIYVRSSRTGEAKTAYEENLRANPNDAGLRINYGTLLVNLNNYSGAIEQFKKAVDLTQNGDEKHQTALFDLGAVYKNWGADLQTAAGDKATKAQIDEYRDKLRESLKYFDQLRAIQGGKDFRLLGEMANLYLVLDQSADFNRTLASLESLKGDNGESSEYWNTMSRLYVVKGDIKKSQDAADKADVLTKQGK